MASPQIEPYGKKQKLRRTRRLLRQTRLDNYLQAVDIASNPPLLESNSATEINEFVKEQRKIIDSFRAQPWPMEMKLAAVQRYKQNISKYVDHLNRFDTMKDSSSQFIAKVVSIWNTALQLLTVWRSIIRKIEGHFGSGVASFFVFLRWLCVLNISLTVLIFSFIVVPQLLVGNGLEVPASAKATQSAYSFIFDGKGYVFEYSVLFYGYYYGANSSIVPSSTHTSSYNISLAYLLTIASAFLASLLLLLFTLAGAYKVVGQASAVTFLVARRALSSWDYTITSVDTARCTKKLILISIKEAMTETKNKEIISSERYSALSLLFWLRIFTNVVIVLLVAASSYCIYLAVEHTTNTNVSITSATQGLPQFLKFLSSFLAQAVVALVNFFFPWIFFIAEIFEKYEPRTALKIKLSRMFLLYLSSLYVVIISLLTVSKECASAGSAGCCWETEVGQAMYRLSITHLAAELLGVVVSDGVRWALVKMNLCKLLTVWLGLAEFELANNILQLVYGQGLVWLGMLFCPLLPIINTLKLITIFYFRAFAVYFFNKPPNTLFPVASTKNFYMGLLTLTLFLCTLPITYTLASLNPSTGCGPFRDLPNMLQVVANVVVTFPSAAQTVFKFLQTSAVLIPVIVILCIGLCYSCALVRTVTKRNNALELQLYKEQRDAKKKFASQGTHAHSQVQEPPQYHHRLNRHRHLTVLLKQKIEPITENEVTANVSSHPPSQNDHLSANYLYPLGLTVQPSQGFAEENEYQSSDDTHQHFAQDGDQSYYAHEEEYEMGTRHSQHKHMDEPQGGQLYLQHMDEPQGSAQGQLYLQHMDEPQGSAQGQLYLQHMDEPQGSAQGQLYLQHMDEPQGGLLYLQHMDEPQEGQLYLHMDEPQGSAQGQLYLQHMDESQGGQLYLQHMDEPQGGQLYLQHMDEPQGSAQGQLYLQHRDEPQGGQLYLQHMDEPQGSVQGELYLQQMDKPQGSVQGQLYLQQMDETQLTQEMQYGKSHSSTQDVHQQVPDDEQLKYTDSYYQTLLTPPPEPPLVAGVATQSQGQDDQGTLPAMPLPHVPDLHDGDITISQPHSQDDTGHLIPSCSIDLYSYTAPPTTLSTLKMENQQKQQP